MNDTVRTASWIIAALAVLAGVFALANGHREPGFAALVVGVLALVGLSRADQPKSSSSSRHPLPGRLAGPHYSRPKAKGTRRKAA